jgi:hypothetical protein
MSSAKESTVTPAQREANGAPHLTPNPSNGSTVEPTSPSNGSHLEPGDAREGR